MKKNKFVFILLAVIAGAAFAYLEFFQKSPDMIAYKNFYEDAGENKIASAEFSKDKIGGISNDNILNIISLE